MDSDPAYDELLARMNALKGPVRKKALKKSLRAMGDLVKDAIVARAPEQTDDVHGVLQAGELKASFRTVVHVGDDENAAGDTDRVTVGPIRKVLDIAVDVETGHNNRPRTQERSRKRTERTEEHPFVRPAFDATKDAAIVLFEETMSAEIEKAMNA